MRVNHDHLRHFGIAWQTNAENHLLARMGLDDVEEEIRPLEVAHLW